MHTTRFYKSTLKIGYSQVFPTPLQLGDCLGTGNRSTWPVVPPPHPSASSTHLSSSSTHPSASSMVALGSLAAAKSPYHVGEAPDYSFVKNHFSPDKLPVPQPDRAALSRVRLTYFLLKKDSLVYYHNHSTAVKSKYLSVKYLSKAFNCIPSFQKIVELL